MDLSSTFSSIYKGDLVSLLRNVSRFFYYVYRTGKVQELKSFILWEFMYRVGYYRNGSTLRFTSSLPHSINDIRNGLTFSHEPASSTGNLLSISTSAIDWRYCFEDQAGNLWGCEYKDSTKLLESIDGVSAMVVATFKSPIRSVYVSRRGVIYVCVSGLIYRSTSTLISFTKVLSLSTPESYFLFNRGMTELPDGTLLLGEYASIWKNGRWIQLANLYVGTNDGLSWQKTDFLIRQGVNKHIHLIKYAACLGKIFLTDGDNKKQIWSNSSNTNLIESTKTAETGWRLINKRHVQMGGYTSMAEHDKGVIFGTDYLGGTNFIVHTSIGDHFRKTVIPNPYRRSPLINMVNRQSGSIKEIWALLHSSITSETKCLLMYSQDNGSTWTRLIEYDGCDYEIQLVSSAHGLNEDIYFCIRHFENSIEYSQTYRITNSAI